MFKYISFDVNTNGKDFFNIENENIKINLFSTPGVSSIFGETEETIDSYLNILALTKSFSFITQNEFKTLVADSMEVSSILLNAAKKLSETLEIIKLSYPEDERETWYIQYSEAINYLEHFDETKTPFLKILSNAEGASVNDFAVAIKRHVETFIYLSANALSAKRLYTFTELSKFGYY